MNEVISLLASPSPSPSSPLPRFFNNCNVLKPHAHWLMDMPDSLTVIEKYLTSSILGMSIPFFQSLIMLDALASDMPASRAI
jgi:hypothetical protein